MPKTLSEEQIKQRSRAGKISAEKRKERGVIGKAGKAFRIFNRMPFDQDSIARRGKLAEVPHAACYLKEARAILAGTKTRINRCQKLVGDD